PFLYRSTGVEPQPVKAVLAVDFTFKPDLTYFLQVRLHFYDSGRLLATPVPGQGSGDLANLLDADAFLELPRGRDLFRQGEVFPCLPYRSWSIK
ncbi:MAG TPA: molybdopterin molybdenumtransferase MoeA, partial [Flammeovirgaceae bacterium]|nr:molybdopterin molybdenumtransferase MoeA [Flammeovirgaceae bacterium]